MQSEDTLMPGSAAQKLIRLVTLGISFILSAALARFAVVGASSRYWAGDYCASAVFAAGGLLRGPLDWFMAWGSRFSTVYLVGLQDALGPAAIGLVPGFILLTLTAGWLCLLAAAVRAEALGVPVAFLSLVPLALAQVFFLVLLAPDRLQDLYWRTGALENTFPLALLLLNLALCLPALKRRPALLRPLGSFLLAFFAGGFSETFAAMQVGAFVLSFAAAAALLPGREKGRAAFAFLPALLGGAAAVGLMLLSPARALPAPASLGLVLADTLDLAAGTLRAAALPLLMLVLLTTSAAYLAFPPRHFPSRSALTAAVLCLLAGLALAACAIAPGVSAGSPLPSAGGLMPARFALLLGLAGASLCLAAWARQARARPPHPALARLLRAPFRGALSLPRLLLILALLSATFYLARHLSQPLPEQERLAAWVQGWDERDVAIRAMRAAGQTDLVVNQTEAAGGLEDIGPDPAHWVNRCAAAYYGVQSVQTLP